MPYLIAPLCGVLITAMNIVNSRFAAAAGGLPSVVVVHIVGLVAVCVLVAARPERAATRAPAYLYSGGIVGVGTLFCCNLAYGNLGASLAVSLALFGQTAFSLVIDATGFLGRPRYPLSLRVLPGLLLAAAGIGVMAGSDFAGFRFAPFGLLSGALPALTFALNSQLGQRIGVFRSTRANYVTGLSASLAVLAAAAFLGGSGASADVAASFAGKLAAAGPGIVLGGGLLGVTMLAGVNYAFPRLPAFSATLLIFSGQTLTGLALDSARSGPVDLRVLAGACLVLAGLAANAYWGRSPVKAVSR